MKYVIEIDDEPFARKSALYGEEALYRANGFRSLVFDETGLKKLTPLTEYMSKYKPENEVFHVGDEVINIDSCETAYVLAPDYGETEFVLLLEGYTHPQYVRKQGWKKTGQNSHEIIKQVELAAKALQGEEK